MKTITNTKRAGELAISCSTTFTDKGVRYDIEVMDIKTGEIVVPETITVCGDVLEVARMGQAIIQKVIETKSKNIVAFMELLGDMTIRPLVNWEVKTKGVGGALAASVSAIETLTKKKEEEASRSLPAVAIDLIKRTIRPGMEENPGCDVEIRGIPKEESDRIVAEVRKEIEADKVDIDKPDASGEIIKQILGGLDAYKAEYPDGPQGALGPQCCCGMPDHAGYHGNDPVKFRLDDAVDFLDCNLDDLPCYDEDTVYSRIATSKQINVWGAKSPEQLMDELSAALVAFGSTGDGFEIVKHTWNEDNATVVIISYWK